MEAALNGPFGRTSLGAGALKIGRAPDNTLVINDPQSSSHHAEVAPGYGNNGYQVTDLNSTNGTFINEQRLAPNTPRPLNNGDVMRIGALTFTYEASGGYAPTIAASGFNSDQTVADQPQAAQATLYPQAAYNAAPPPPPFAPAPQQPPAFQQPSYPQPQPASFNQSGYPLPQPGFGQPYPQKKKSRAGLWITLVVLLLLVGGGISGYIYVNRSTPEKTLQAYCTALQNNDAQGIYNTLSSTLQANTDLNKIKTVLQLLDLAAGGGFTNCTSSNVTVNGNSASATVTLTATSGKSIGEPAQLVDENGQWKISAGSKLPGV
ncbi:MAG TPA: FHA domain-containing protein [Ktedonobacteraceae bacterium]